MSCRPISLTAQCLYIELNIIKYLISPYNKHLESMHLISLFGTGDSDLTNISLMWNALEKVYDYVCYLAN